MSAIHCYQWQTDIMNHLHSMQLFIAKSNYAYFLGAGNKENMCVSACVQKVYVRGCVRVCAFVSGVLQETELHFN